MIRTSVVTSLTTAKNAVPNELHNVLSRGLGIDQSAGQEQVN